MRSFRTAFVTAMAAMLVLVAPAMAGNPFGKAATTADGYHTYDSDQINVEGSPYTGEGVYVAVLDTGLVPNWSDYFPKDRIATNLGTGFYQNLSFRLSDTEECTFEEIERGPLVRTTFIGSRGSTHGSHVTSTILGYSYQAKQDAIEGYPLPPIQVRGIAPNVTVIPVKVLADYQLPPAKGCPAGTGGAQVFGTDSMVAAGINYVTDLAEGILKGKRIVINMSLGGDELVEIEKAAIDRAIAAGVIVVASAGNEGADGMGYPGTYEPVISAGAAGWTGEWLVPGQTPDEDFVRYRVWWLKNTMGTAATEGDLVPPLPEGTGDVVEGAAVAGETYVADFSSRELEGQDLDVLAPGAWVRGPFPGTPGYNHLPWWANGLGDVLGLNSGNYYYVGGTSMASPHVAAVAAMMLEANPTLTQAGIDAAMTSTAIDIGAGTRQVWDPFNAEGPGFYEISWGADAAGEGLLQADLAIAAVGG